MDIILNAQLRTEIRENRSEVCWHYSLLHQNTKNTVFDIKAEKNTPMDSFQLAVYAYLESMQPVVNFSSI